MITDSYNVENFTSVMKIVEKDKETIKDYPMIKNIEGFKIVNDHNKDLIGIVLMDTETNYITHIEVYGEYKEKTYGKILLRCILNNGAKHVIIDKNNRIAINLFEIYGFTISREDDLNYHMSIEYQGGNFK